MVSLGLSAVVNALAFTGASYTFRQLDKKGSLEELKRHNLATEKLSRAKEKWYERETERKNKIEEKIRELDNSNADINVTNKALDNLAAILEQQIAKLKLEGTPEPDLYDFYKPSEKMRQYEMLTIVAIGLTGGFGVHEVYRYLKTK